MRFTDIIFILVAIVLITVVVLALFRSGKEEEEFDSELNERDLC